MTENLYSRYLKVHNKMIDEHGFSVKALYGSLPSQQKRFEAFYKLFDSDEKFSVLDLGCGLCDFYQFLSGQKSMDVDYTGVDINEKFISESARRYPNIELITGSTEEITKTNRKWDYIVASGIYNLGENADQARDFFLQQFDLLFPLINKGFAVNFLSTCSPNPQPDSVYQNPSEMIKKCIDHYGSRVEFYQNYLPHDFTIFVFK